MKQKLSILFLFICLACGAQNNLTVIYSFVNGFGQPQNVKQVSFTPMSFGVQTNLIVVGDETFRVVSATNLSVNLISGFAYRIKYFSTIQPPTVTTVFTNSFPTNLTGTIYAANWIQPSTNLGNGIYALTKAQADLLYAPIGSSSTNFLLGGVVTNLTTGNSFSASGSNVIANIAATLGVPANLVTTNDARAVSLTNAGNVFAGTFVGSGWTFTNYWSAIGTATNQYFCTNFPDTSYNGVYSFVSAASTNAFWTNSNGRCLAYYFPQSYMFLQPYLTNDFLNLIPKYDSYGYSLNYPHTDPSWEDSVAATNVAGFNLAPDSQLTTVAQRLPFGPTLVTTTNFNGSGTFAGNVSGSLSGTFTGTDTNAVFYGNAGGATNVTFHSTVFLNWWDEVDTISDSFGSMFVTNNFLNTNTTAFCQAVPPSLTNTFSAFTNAPWLYTNGFVCWLGRGSGTGTNTSLFITLTNYFAVANHPVTLNMACSVPGIGAQQQAIGGTTGSAGTDLYKFYPPYSASSPPGMNYPLSIASATTGFRKLVIVGPIGINDCGAMPAINVFTNIYKICLGQKLAGNTVVLVTQPIPWATSHGGVAVTQQQLASNLVNAVNFPADLTIDLAAYSASLNESNSMSPWLGDLLHPSYATATNWAAFVWRGITNNFAVSQSQISSLLSTNGNGAGITNLAATNLTGTATINTTGNAGNATNFSGIDTNQFLVMVGGKIAGSNYLVTIPTGATNAFSLNNNGVATNLLLQLGSGTSIIVAGSNSIGAELEVTNSSASGFADVGVQFNNGNFTTNYFVIGGNNSAFVPGSTWIGTTNSGFVEYNGADNPFLDIIGAGSWIFASRPSTNGTVNTNAIIGNASANFKVPVQFGGTNLIYAVAYTNFGYPTNIGGTAFLGTNNFAGGGGGAASSNYVALTAGALVTTNAHLFGMTTNNVSPAQGQFSLSTAGLNTNVIQIQNYELTNANAYYYWSSATNAYTNSTVGMTIAKATNAIGSSLWWCLISNNVFTNFATLNTNQAVALGMSTNAAATNATTIGQAVGLWQRGYIPLTIGTNGTQNPPVMSYAYTNGNFLTLNYSGDGTNQVSILNANSNLLSINVPQTNYSTSGFKGASFFTGAEDHEGTETHNGSSTLNNNLTVANATVSIQSGSSLQMVSSFYSTSVGIKMAQGNFLGFTRNGVVSPVANSGSSIGITSPSDFVLNISSLATNTTTAMTVSNQTLCQVNISGYITASNGVSTYGNKIPTAVTVGGSPFTFSNAVGVAVECYFSGGTAYSITKNGASVYGSLAGNDYFVLQPTNVCVITYSIAPTFYTNTW